MRIFPKKQTGGRLCSAILALSLVFAALRLPSVRADEATGDPQDDDNPYIYAVEIEFGSLGFYYDHGTWNEDTFRYDASSTSTHPAADTEAGSPGWYGFDGVANRIRVTNLTPETADADTVTEGIKIELRYSDRSDGYYDFPLASGSVSMYCYAEPELVTCLNTDTPNVYEFVMSGMPAGGEAPESSVYLSFSGVPRTAQGELFIHSSAQRIGTLTLAVSLSDS